MTTSTDITKPSQALTLPEWFDIKNYEACKDLTPKQWATQLHYRFVFTESLKTGQKLNLEDPNHYGIPLKVILEDIRERGITIIDVSSANLSLDELILTDPSNSSSYKKYTGLRTTAIKPLLSVIVGTAGEEVQTKTYEQLKSEDKDKAEKARALYMNAPYDVFRIENSQHDEGYMESSAWISINMSLPDSEIMEQVKKFIPAYRKLLSIEVTTKKSSHENIKKLVDYNMLAIFDLHIWELENNVKIKPAVLLRALYSGRDIGEDQLKSYLNLSKKLLNENFIALLKEK